MDLKQTAYFLLLGGLFFALGFSFPVNAQNEVEFGYYSATSEIGKETKVADLTKEAIRKCNRSLAKQVGTSSIEIKFSPEFTDEARNIFTALENSVNETQKVLFPRRVEDVRFYLLQVDEIPVSYKMTDSVTDREFYLDLWIFKNKETLNLSCNKDDKLCDSVYKTIPHELTHGAIEGLVDHKDASWFEEGLSNYVGREVSRSCRSSSISDKFDENIQKVTLHRPDIRNDLFSWNHSSVGKDTNFIRNEWFHYIASEYLIKLIIENLRKKWR